MILDNISYKHDNTTLENNSTTYSYDDDDDYSSLEYDSNYSTNNLLYISNDIADIEYDLENNSIDDIDERNYNSLYSDSEYISLYMEVLQYDGYRKKYIIGEEVRYYHMIELSWIKYLQLDFTNKTILSYRIEDHLHKRN